MVLRIFLESKPALYGLVGSGHLYLVLRDVSVDANGNVTSNVETVNDWVIHGFPNGSLTHLEALEEPLLGSLDGYGAAGNEEATHPGDTVANRNSVDITSYVLAGGGYADAQSAWNAMASYVNGIGAADYDYELPDNFTNHIANSNSTTLSVRSVPMKLSGYRD